MKYPSTLLAQTAIPQEIQKADLDLLKKINEVDALTEANTTKIAEDYITLDKKIDTVYTTLTAAINSQEIQSGSNANGRWIKFSDGTMQQWGLTPSVQSIGIANWFGTTSGTSYYAAIMVTYPLAFISAPHIQMTATGGCGVVRTQNETVNEFLGQIFSGSAETLGFYWFASGRWF